MRLLSGKYDINDLEYISKKTDIDEEKCYVEIQLDEQNPTEEFSDDDKKQCLQRYILQQQII
ncbi:hypothetical protein CIY_10140 [Butyrivibrio fibrisolvens 16/4]|nr:hypothetical protein CIY_10140 [Butyrivibrio fibrisolvens 16/4]